MYLPTHSILFNRVSRLVNLWLIIALITTTVLPPVSYAASAIKPSVTTSTPPDIEQGITTANVTAPPQTRPPLIVPHQQNSRLTSSLILTSTTFLPVILKSDGTSQPDTLITPGTGGQLLSPDGTISVEFNPGAVESNSFVNYNPGPAVTNAPEGWRSVGNSFYLAASRQDNGAAVTNFIPQVITLTYTSPYSPDAQITQYIVTNTVRINVNYTAEKVAGVDENRLMLHFWDGTTWTPMLTLIDPIANTTETETDHFTQFALFGPATGEIVAAATEYVILDPDHGGANPGGQVTYPPAFAAVEKTFNLDVAQRVKQKLAACSVAVDMTRDTDTTVSSAARAAFINSRRPNLAMTLAFNIAQNNMWLGLGGVQGLIDLSQPADVALVNRTRGHVALLGVSNHRPNLDARTWPLCGGNCVGTNVPGIKFAQMELAFMDNYGDRAIMDSPGGMDAFANAVYNSIIEELGLVGKCNLMPPPSADQINKWRALGYQNWLRYRGDPVTTSTGNHIQQFRLLHVPGRGGLDVDITLTYNSLDDRAGDFGYGWSWPYGAKLARYRDEGVTIQHADGQTHYYAFDGSNYTAPAGIFDRLVRNNDGSYTLTRPDQSTMRFDDQGRLQAIADRRGNTLSFSYNGAQLTTITDTAGRIFNITYTGNTISRITDPLGRTLNFSYTGQDLTGITDANQGTRRFEYDGQHLMTKLVDPENITYLRNIYDNQGRVVEQIDASGVHSYFTYQADRTIFTDNLGHQTTDVYDALYRVVETIDANHQSTRYQYDSAYNLVKSTDARGYATLYEYDGRGNQRKRTDPIDNLSAPYYSTDVTTWEYNAQNDLTKTTNALGHSTTFEYDAQGNLTAIHAPGGRNTTFAYNAWGQPTRMTDPNNHTTLYEYDTYGNLIKTTDAEGNVSTSTYDLVGRETAYTDANGHTARFVYDGNDNITRITDPKNKPTDFVYNKNDLLTQTTDRRGGVTRYEYDENLKLTAEIDPEGYRTEYDYDLMYNRVWMKNARGHLTRYQYDALYRLTHVTDANNHLTRYEYDPDGNLTAVIDALTQRTEMRYDAVNRLKYLQDTLNGQTEYIYDAEDQLTRLIDPRRAATGYEYDAVGNLVRLIDPLGKVTTYQYDLADNLRFVTDPNNHTREYAYDRIDRLIRERNPLGHERQIHYDPVGNILTRIDPRGNETNLAYDENGNLVSATDALVNSIFYQYDAEDNQIALIDQRSHATYFGYDLRGLMIGLHEPGNHETLFEYDGNANLVGLTNAKGQITRYSYDPVDLLVKETDPLGAETHYSYDALNRLTQTTDAEGQPTGYGYDALDRLNRVTDALNGVTHYGYDPVGNLIQITDANNQITHFEYNLRNELVKEINPLNHTWAYSYDDAGNLITRLDANGQPTHYDYDAADQLAKIRYPSAIGSSGLEVSFAYDEAGNEISMSDWNGLTTHQYDVLNRRTQTIGFDGATLAYTYDKTSNLTGLTYPNGQTVAYGYDARNRLTSLTDPFNQTTAFNYDPLGALTGITRPNGADTELSYDAANRLVNLSHKKDGTAFSAFAYALDKVGNRTQIAELRTFSGSPVPVTTLKSYDYDALYRLVGAATDKGQDVAYNYDAVGNRQKQEGIPQALDPTDGLEPLRPALPISATYTYNAANQLTAVSSLASTTGLTYDNNGNRLSQTEVMTDGTTRLTDYAYDHENRLVGVTKAISVAATITPTLVATYTYDGYGRRVKKEVNSSPFTIHNSQFTIHYLYNGLDPIADTETVGSVTTATHYLWANGGIAEIIRQPNPATGFPGDLYWTHTDGLGSLVDLTDPAGDSVSQVYYDEYGQLLTDFHSLTRYSYTGQEFDPETGLYHFYARYYDAERGVWLGLDRYRGAVSNPASLHLYSFVENNPATYIDSYGYLKACAPWDLKCSLNNLKEVGDFSNNHLNPLNSDSTVRQKIINPTGNAINNHLNPANPNSTIRKKIIDPGINQFQKHLNLFNPNSTVRKSANKLGNEINKVIGWLPDFESRCNQIYILINGIANGNIGPSSSMINMRAALEKLGINANQIRDYDIYHNPMQWMVDLKGVVKDLIEAFNFNVYSDQLAAIIQSYNKQGKNVNLVCHSGGGQVCVNASAKAYKKTGKGADNMFLIGAPTFQADYRGTDYVASIEALGDPLAFEQIHNSPSNSTVKFEHLVYLNLTGDPHNSYFDGSRVDNLARFIDDRSRRY